MSTRIVIADSKENSRRMLRELLTRAGYSVQAEARNVPDLLRKVRMILPDLVILDSSLEGGSTMEVAGILEDDNLGAVLVLSSESESRRMGDVAHIQKPYTEETLLSVIELSILYRSKVLNVQKEVDRLKENLNSRKLIEKAKGIIMTNMSIPENEAYRLMQKQSMDKGLSMKDLAKAVIVAEEKQTKMNKER